MSKDSRKEIEKKFKRNYIIEKATELFLKNGFEKTTMLDIAKESDFAKGTLYLYFNSKEDIIIEIKKNIFENLLVKMKLLIKSKTTVQKKFTQMLELYKDEFFYKVERFGLKQFFNKLAETCVIDYTNKSNNTKNKIEKDNLARINQIVFEIFNIDVELIRLGQKDGFINDKVNPELTAFLIDSLMLGTSINMVSYENSIMKENNLTIGSILNGSLEFILSSITNKSF